MREQELIDTLPQLQRLAMAYAPTRARSALLGLFALDTRLCAIVRASREPMLAQLRLAWWREVLGGTGAPAPAGEPLLAALQHWPGSRDALIGMVDGWEAMTGSAPLPPDAPLSLAEARGKCFAALAGEGEIYAAALRMGRNWALADIATHLSDPRERQAVLKLARAQDWRWQPLPRALRPLAVLHGLAARVIWRDAPLSQVTPRALLAAMRVGLFGR